MRLSRTEPYGIRETHSDVRAQNCRPISKLARMIAIAFWSTASFLLAAAAVAGGALLRSRNFVWWDGALFTPLVLWLILSSTGLRPKSLSNLIEPIIVAAVILVTFSLRAFAFRSYSHKARSIAAIVVSCGAAIMLYVLVPLLPE